MPPPEPEDGNRPERHHRRSARTPAQAARATASTAAPAARAADRRASPAERSARRSNRPSSPARAPASCSRPPAPCSRGRSGRCRKFAYAPRTIANRATVQTSTAPQIASDHAWSRIASDTRACEPSAVHGPGRGAHAPAFRNTSTPSSSNTFTQLGSSRIRSTNATRASGSGSPPNRLGIHASSVSTTIQSARPTTGTL